MVSPLSGSSGYEHQLEIILKQQLKIEDLQEKLVNNGGSYAAMLRREEDVQLKFVDLMVQTYPQLASFSPPEIVTMMESLDMPAFVSLHTQITDLLGSYGSIAELQDALDAAEQLVVVKSDAKAVADQAVVDAGTALAQADEVLFLAIDDVKTAKVELAEGLAAIAAAQIGVDNATAAYTAAVAAADLAGAELATAESSVVDLHSLFTDVADLDTQLQAIVGGNPFYALYDGFSDTEKELIALFSN